MPFDVALFFLFLLQMLEKSLLKFAEENFSDKYCASLHGETKRIRPLALTVKRHRSLFKRPFGKNELIILEGLEKYVESEEEQEAFCKALNKMITEEGLFVEPKLSLGESSSQFGVDISGAMEVTVKLHEDRGDLGLGKLSQKYITDPDIRSLLGKTALDVKKMEPYDEDELHLITSVIYSEKFELTGNRRKQEKEYSAQAGPLPWSANTVYGNAVLKTTETPPGVAVRNIQGPLLFKCCRVEYNKKTNRLEIPKGEYVGKTVYCSRNADSTPKAEDSEYSDIIVNSNLDEADSQEYTVEDMQKLGAIEKELLLPGMTRTQRKARISKYLHWFVRSLSTDEHMLTLEEPLSNEDCNFLRQVYLPSEEDSTMLDLTSLSKEDVQSYGIVFNTLDSLSDEKWTELERTFDGPK